MGNVLSDAVAEVFGFVRNALTDPRAWLAAGLLLAAVGTAVFVRGKLAWGLWLPILVGLAFFAWRHFRPY
ncbi:MAG: hypothetical protein ACJ77T_03785 [Gemmatimonadaceae bacterium]